MLKTSKEMKIKTDIHRDLSFRAEYHKFISIIQHSMDQSSLEGQYQATVVLKNMSREMFWYIDNELKSKKYNVVSTWGFYKSYFIINWFNVEYELEDINNEIRKLTNRNDYSDEK